MQPPSRAPSAPRLDRQQGGERASIDPPCRASRLVAILIAPSFGKRDFRRSLESPPPPLSLPFPLTDFIGQRFSRATT